MYYKRKYGRILKCSDFRADVLNPRQRLIVTIRFLATGASFRHLAFSFRLGRKTVATIVRETCDVIYEVLQPKFLRFPESSEEWKRISDDFWRKWNLPLCCGCPYPYICSLFFILLGAIGGKHVQLKAPSQSSALYYNYKGYFSSVLLAVSDANYRFVYASFGSYGHESDGGIFDRCELSKIIDDGSIGLPPNEFLPRTSTKIPYYFVGDAAFPLLPQLLKPFPGENLDKKMHL